ncbi:MAG TPA: hypothetical protein VFU38_05210 [Candidatus Krumholzibacteria bacterium]|nr:hypothetical protein [Candidatus Krumholzibacteria bacterium]
MRRLLLLVFALCVLSAGTSRAQVDSTAVDSTAADTDSATTPAATPPATAAPVAVPPTSSPRRQLRDRVYFGGSVTLSFGDVTRIGVYPMIAYKFTPKLSVGTELGYEYLKYDDIDQSANNYGGSVFSRYRIIPQLYAHAEYQMVNYEIFTSPTTSDREWIPYLLFGGGLASRIGPNTWGYIEVLFDVLNDDHSPYDEGEPIISAGVGVGF